MARVELTTIGTTTNSNIETNEEAFSRIKVRSMDNLSMDRKIKDVR
jgi:hypothetical protein